MTTRKPGKHPSSCLYRTRGGDRTLRGSPVVVRRPWYAALVPFCFMSVLTPAIWPSEPSGTGSRHGYETVDEAVRDGYQTVGMRVMY